MFFFSHTVIVCFGRNGNVVEDDFLWFHFILGFNDEIQPVTDERFTEAILFDQMNILMQK